ncbi:MAG TPA: pyridoxal-phosphate dependent enzyme [Gaiellaceae bacterium]|nr:pyridoxal-phosphate dependent enzyme [Gaiellaceae bacterium]
MADTHTTSRAALQLPTRRDVERAAATIAPTLQPTPLLQSRTLGARLKCELFQRTGSFKVRGALNRIASLTEEERARGVITISAGNHAQAVAYAAAQQGVDALVVMWCDASVQKVAATRGYGATVDLEARDPADAFGRLEKLHAESGRTLIHPFDDPLVVAGAGTVGLEIDEQAPDADAVVVAVGGGGLVSGIRTALRDTSTRVIAVEPELSPALHAALERGEPTPVEPRSIADGLSAPFAGRLAIEICRDIERVLVTEDEIRHAFRFLYERAKLACEPAGAAATAAWLAGKVDARRPVLVVSGGNVAAETAAAILAAR